MGDAVDGVMRVFPSDYASRTFIGWPTGYAADSIQYSLTAIDHQVSNLRHSLWQSSVLALREHKDFENKYQIPGAGFQRLQATIQ
jgi:hypothetical protein